MKIARKNLIIDEEIKNLYIPLDEQQRRILSWNVRSGEIIEPFPVWNGIVLSRIEEYTMCCLYRIKISTIQLKFNMREEAVSWVCQQLLLHELSRTEYRRYLIGKRYNAEKVIAATEGRYEAKGFSCLGRPQGRPPADHNRTANMLRLEYGISTTTICMYGSYAAGIDAIRSKTKLLGDMLMSGEATASASTIAEMSECSKEELERISGMVKSEHLTHILPRDLFEHPAAQKKTKHGGTKKEPEPRPVIKQMPKYDPDAEVLSLALTIPSWESSINRIFKNSDLGQTTPPARKNLTEQLSALEHAANRLKKALEEKNEQQ